MKRLLLCTTLLAPSAALADGVTLLGPTGLLTVPTAEVQEEGSGVFAAGQANTLAQEDGAQDYLASVGFAPGLELGGRAAELPNSNDLSFNAKYQFWKFDAGLMLAVGGTDLGGEAAHFRSRYAVATLPWHTLSVTAGYGWGPDLQEGTLAGLEWRPVKYLGFFAEYDSEDVNPGLRLQSGPLWRGWRVSALVGQRGATDEVEGLVQLTVPLGYREVPPAPARRETAVQAPRGDDRGASLRAALTGLGFESVRTGTGPDGTLNVALENRRYNHAASDGIGLALGTIAAHAGPDVERVELALSSYGVPQVKVSTSAAGWRDYVQTGVGSPGLIEVRNSGGATSGVKWHNEASPLEASELVIEPVLRTFVATEFGMLDAGLGARARYTAALGGGLVGHLGVQVPVAGTDDFHDGRNFEKSGPEAGLDLAMLQYAHKQSPDWTWLWSVGRAQVFQTDLTVFGHEELWMSPLGRHRLNLKLMNLNSGIFRRNLALGGYTWFDASRKYSAGVTAGRFYAEDSGFRLDLNRYFGDTIAGLFLKVEAQDNMAGGFQMSIPLTPRRDAYPAGLQVKGARRWNHSLQTTLNLADNSNALKPFLLYEPVFDYDLRRDFFDGGRLSAEYLEGELPRMREAYLLWTQ